MVGDSSFQQMEPRVPNFAMRGRFLIKQGPLQQIQLKKSQRKFEERYVFVFSDYFLITTMVSLSLSHTHSHTHTFTHTLTDSIFLPPLLQESSLIGGSKYSPITMWYFHNEQLTLEFPPDMITWGLPQEIIMRLSSAFHLKTPYEFSSFFAPNRVEKEEWVAIIQKQMEIARRPLNS